MDPPAKRSTPTDAFRLAATWENLPEEILGQIFLRVSPLADEMVRTVSFVCRGWLEVFVSRYCWVNIDVEKWCRTTSRRDLIDSVVRKLVRRSKCTVRSLSAYRLGNVGFAYVASCGRFLTVLQIPLSQITDDMVEKHVGSLVNLKELDISYCLMISYKSLLDFGKNCKSLTNLKRNLIPSKLSKTNEDDLFPELDDSEAYAIAKTMPGLSYLELANGCFGDRGLSDILTNCKSLTHLDIEGCENVDLEGDLKERGTRLLYFKIPVYDYVEESSESGSSGGDSDDSDEEPSSPSVLDPFLSDSE